jgi:GMP synthase-like glutamine amidotransferase
MLVIVYFDVFYRDLVTKLKTRYKLVHYTQIHAGLTPSALIITGSKKRILREPSYPELDALIRKTTGRVIGICYGFQYLARLSGGLIREGTEVFRGIREPKAPLGHYYNHYDKVVKLPKPWIELEHQDDFISIAYEPKKQWIGYQFHPEKKFSDFEKYIGSLI